MKKIIPHSDILPKISEMHIGSRGEDFRRMVTSVLRKGRIKSKYMDKLTDKKAMIEYGKVFTGVTADPINNYEIYEQIGDVTANKFIVWYAYKRFPQLYCPKGVKVVARLRINYGAKNFFHLLGEKLGFWPYISALEVGEGRGKYRSRHKKELLEDVFEAFIGCTEYLIDKMYRPGVGYGIVYDILTEIFDQIPMSLKYEELYDAKTRLKETFDTFKYIGTWWFYDKRDFERGLSISEVYLIPQGQNSRPLEIRKDNEVEYRPRPTWIKLGTGLSTNKGESQQNASLQGIETLKKRGYYKHPPSEYAAFQVGNR